MLNQKILQRLAACSLLLLGNQAFAKEPAVRPNIVFILADDLGYGEIGCYGQEKIKTPNIDQLAKDGMSFSNHYSGHPLCSASRGSLMTGKHLGHSPIQGQSGKLKESDITIPMLLKGAGYKTCMIGKWGMVGRPGHAGSPNNKGFDHFFGFGSQGAAHFYYPEFIWRNDQKVLFPKNHDLRVNGEYKKGEGTYIHDEFLKEALGWIRANKEDPFFLYLPFAIPHAEFTVPEDSLAPYLALNWPEKPWKEGTKGSTGGGKNPGYGTQYTKGYCAQSHPNATYAGMVSRMDRSIGTILDLLDELGLSDNTLVVFTSDNGPAQNKCNKDNDFFKSTGPFRGAKGSVVEGGIHIPHIVRWPGKIAPGSSSDHISAFWDFLPTVCDLAGVEAPSDIDGISYLPELLGKPEQQQQHEYLYWHLGGQAAIRVGPWKLYRKTKGGQTLIEMYNLENDIGEVKDLARDMPELVERYAKYFDLADDQPKKGSNQKEKSKRNKS